MTDSKTKLSDITAGGRIRRAFQPKIWQIAKDASVKHRLTGTGTPMSSQEITTLEFLDGGVRDARGYFDSSSGMFWSGELAKAYVLYELGLNPQVLLRTKTIPSHADLRSMLDQQRKVEASRKPIAIGLNENPATKIHRTF